MVSGSNPVSHGLLSYGPIKVREGSRLTAGDGLWDGHVYNIVLDSKSNGIRRRTLGCTPTPSTAILNIKTPIAQETSRRRP